MNPDRYMIFCTESYEYLADALCADPALERAVLCRRRFPDGELYLRIDSKVHGRDVVLVGGTISDADTLELYDLACGLVKYGARTLTMILPYFGYSTMERATVEGEVVVAKTRARLLSSVPSAGGGNRIVLLDLHSEGLPHYFEGSLRPVHLSARQVVGEALSEMPRGAYVLGCADLGRAKWAQSLSHSLGCDAAYVVKRRCADADAEVSAISAQVKGKHVVVFDDMARTGSSLMAAAAAYSLAGAKSLSAVVTHGVFAGDALERIRASGYFQSVSCTDSHPRAAVLKSEFLKVHTVAPIILRFLEGAGNATY